MDKIKEIERIKISELQVIITANIEVIYHEQETTIQSKFELSRKSVGDLSWIPPQIWTRRHNKGNICMKNGRLEFIYG